MFFENCLKSTSQKRTQNSVATTLSDKKMASKTGRTHNECGGRRELGQGTTSGGNDRASAVGQGTNLVMAMLAGLNAVMMQALLVVVTVHINAAVADSVSGGTGTGGAGTP